MEQINYPDARDDQSATKDKFPLHGDSQLMTVNINIAIIAGSPPGIIDDIKLVGVHQDELQHCIHHQQPPQRITQVVPVVVRHLGNRGSTPWPLQSSNKDYSSFWVAQLWKAIMESQSGSPLPTQLECQTKSMPRIHITINFREPHLLAVCLPKLTWAWS